MNKVESALQRTTDTKALVIGSDALPRSAEMFKELFPGKRAIIVADKITYPLAGEAVKNYFDAAGIAQDEPHVYGYDDSFAEWTYVEELENVLKKTDAIPVAVGSGVINDLTKLTAHRCGRRYMCVGTAASMDGYTAYGASITYQGNKQTFDCPAPYGMALDPRIAAKAPKAMSASGYADLIAKIPAGADWMIADVVGSEAIDRFAFDLVQDGLQEALSDPEGVYNGDVKKVEQLAEGLLLSGFAMQAAKSSRPASCTEHLFSHVLDMTHHRYNGKFQSHGFQVAIGTLTMCAFFDEFFKMDLSTLDVDACVAAWPSLEAEQRRALDLFRDFPVPELGYTEITKKWNDAETVRVQLTRVKENWPAFKARLQAQCYPFEKMRALFAAAGAPTDPSQIGVSREQLRSMVDFTQLLRWRINLLDLAKRARIYDELVARVFGKGGAWEIA
mgnify:CR=1 FL=1